MKISAFQIFSEVNRTLQIEGNRLDWGVGSEDYTVISEQGEVCSVIYFSSTYFNCMISKATLEDVDGEDTETQKVISHITVSKRKISAFALPDYLIT